MEASRVMTEEGQRWLLGALPAELSEQVFMQMRGGRAGATTGRATGVGLLQLEAWSARGTGWDCVLERGELEPAWCSGMLCT